MSPKAHRICSPGPQSRVLRQTFTCLVYLAGVDIRGLPCLCAIWSAHCGLWPQSAKLAVYNSLVGLRWPRQLSTSGQLGSMSTESIGRERASIFPDCGVQRGILGRTMLRDPTTPLYIFLCNQSRSRTWTNRVHDDWRKAYSPFDIALVHIQRQKTDFPIEVPQRQIRMMCPSYYATGPLPYDAPIRML